MSGQLKRSVVAALASLIAIASGLAASLVTGDAWPPILQPYRHFGWWTVLLLALAASVIAVWQVRQQRGFDGAATARVDMGGGGPVAVGTQSVAGGDGLTAGRDLTITTTLPSRAGSDTPMTLTNLPPRNPNFAGRAKLLAMLRDNLAANAASVVIGRAPDGESPEPRPRAPHALHGLSGVGKSQLALEYAYRNERDYDIRWWIPAEQPVIIPATLAALSRALGLPDRGGQEQQAADVVNDLGGRSRWLLIFDNAVRPSDIAKYLPCTGGGHVLITSRNPTWGGIASRVDVSVFQHDEAVGFLLSRTGCNDQESARLVAEELGGLPLALEQAAAYIEQTELSLSSYLSQCRPNRERLLGRGEPVAYGATVDATFLIACRKIGRLSPAASQLLEACSFLAPDQIPEDLFVANPRVLPRELAKAAQDEIRFAELVGILRQFSLVERDHVGLRVHRLVQAVTRHHLTPRERQLWVRRWLELLASAWPKDAWLPAARPSYRLLLSHALTVAAHARQCPQSPRDLRRLTRQIDRYLDVQSNATTKVHLLQHALDIQEQAYGPYHSEVASTLHQLGVAWQSLGEWSEAEACLERALSIIERISGLQDPRITAIQRDIRYGQHLSPAGAA